MKISERCKKQIEQINQTGLKLKEIGHKEPYSVVMWEIDFESIMELYLAYKDGIEHINAIDAENDKLEAENKKLKEKVSELHTIKKSFEVLRALYLGDYEDEPF